MTEEMLHAVLETAGAKADKEGWSTLPEGRLMTLYAAHGGVPLTMAKVEAVKVSQRIVWARTSKGETYLVGVEDLFAAALDRGHEAQAGRKAGFLG
jgi:phytoene dehydrogenase-like protein